MSLTSIKTGVLVIGGGVAGVWLLSDLIARGYAAILLEKGEIGGAQTCHSHVYIHQGHLYHDAALAVGVKRAGEYWQRTIANAELDLVERASYFGFVSSADAQLRADLWARPDLNLPSISLPLERFPKALDGGAIKVVYESPEYCLDAESILRALSKGTERNIGAVDEVVSFQSATSRIEAVQVKLRGGALVRIEPRAVVLCAGSENQALLLLATGGARGHLTAVQEQQQIRKAHMLIVRGKDSDLPALTGVFPSIGGLFLVSRRLNGDNVWLISDDRSPSIGFPEDWMRFGVNWWFPRVWSSLRRIAPSYFNNPERLQWGIYEAPKAEGRATGAIPREEKILKFGWDNLWAVWPTKLTLAPLVSQKVMEELKESGLFPDFAQLPDRWMEIRHFPGYAPERWKKTYLMDWGSFKKLHDIVSTSYRVEAVP